jgi:hypothetical protein
VPNQWVQVHHDELDATAVIADEAVDQWGRLGWRPISAPREEKVPALEGDADELSGEPAQAGLPAQQPSKTTKPTSKKAGPGPAEEETNTDGE